MSELPQGWAETAGDSVFEYVRGVTYQKQQARDVAEIGFTGILRATNIQDGALDNDNLVYVPSDLVSEKQTLRLGDQVIAASSGSISVVGKAAPVSNQIVGLSFGAFCAVARPRTPEIQDWLRLFFQSPEYRQFVSDTAMGNNINNLRSSDLVAIRLPLPPLPEQRRIVAKVDGLTARTARARKELDRIPTLIARYKQRLLALAAEGLLTRNWRDEKCGKAWMTTTVAGLAETTFDGPFGSNLKSADYVDSGVRVVRLENIGSLRFIREKETYITEAKFKSLQRHELKPDDVLFSSFIAEEIRVCLLPDDLETVAINKADCFCVRVDRSKCLPEFLAYRLASPTCYEVLKDAVHGATRPRISLSHLKQFEIELPPLEEQAEIVRRIESAFGWLDRVAADHGAAARLLPKLDAAILTKAFRGELVPQDPNDEPAAKLLERIKREREADSKKPKIGRGRKPNGSKVMTEKPLLPRDRLLKDSEKWPSAGLPFEAIAMRNPLPHDALRDALFELLSGSSPVLQQRFDSDAEVMVIQRVAA